MHIKRTEEEDRTIYLIPIYQVRRLNVTPRYCELLDSGSLRFSLPSMALAGACSVKPGRFWNSEFIQSAPKKDIIDVDDISINLNKYSLSSSGLLHVSFCLALYSHKKASLPLVSLMGMKWKRGRRDMGSNDKRWSTEGVKDENLSIPAKTKKNLKR
ncbi:hypothetical protein L2E82_51063 [Cichorium intybus]|nr:hypothetical protein L2E82_51063 [Cichorium intybus]